MRKILMLLCTICLVLSLTVSASAAALSFSDANLAQNSDEMAMLVDLGLISGYQDGTIGPRQPISRQEIAKLCSQISGERPPRQAAVYRCRCGQLGAPVYRGLLCQGHHFRQFRWPVPSQR